MFGFGNDDDEKRKKGTLTCPHCGEGSENRKIQSDIPTRRVDESIPKDKDWSVHLVPASRTRSMRCQNCREIFKFTWRIKPF